MDESKPKLEYTDEFELLLKQESERSEAYSILHSKCHSRYTNLSVGINIPVIVLSSIVGFLSTINLFDGKDIFLGALSICIAIAKALESYFDWTKRSEAHRMVSLNYGKISKYIQIQLSLEKEVRIAPEDLLNIITNDIQNLKDQEPLIPKKIIREFNLQYKNDTTSKPSICNGLTSVSINKKLLSPNPSHLKKIENFYITQEEKMVITPPSSPIEIPESIIIDKPKEKPRWKG
jgi:hypothetical protein